MIEDGFEAIYVEALVQYAQDLLAAEDLVFGPEALRLTPEDRTRAHLATGWVAFMEDFPGSALMAPASE